MMVTVQAPPATEGDLGAEVLFKEARRRARRRRLGVAAIVLVAGLRVGISLGVGGGGSSLRKGQGSVALNSPTGFPLRVLHDTLAAGSATMAFADDWYDPGSRYTPTSRPHTRTIRGSGVADFVEESFSYSDSLSISPLEEVVVVGPDGQVQRGPQGQVFRSIGTIALAARVQIRRVLYLKGTDNASRAGITASGQGDPLQTLLSSSYAPDLLKAITWCEPAGTSILNGARVTVYQAHIALSQFLGVADSVFGVKFFNGSVPSASKVLVQVRLWVDSADRLVRMQVSEPQFVGIYRSPFVTGHGGYQVPSRSSGSPLFSVDESGYERITVGFSHFGRPAHIQAPIATR
jgi:hypothetical protein